MATNQYTLAIGDALTTALNFISANQASMKATGFSVTWQTGTAPQGGFFQVTYSPLPSGSPVVFNGHAAETLGGGAIPLHYVCRTGLFYRPIIANYSGLTGPTISDVVFAVAQGMEQCLVAECGATVVLNTLQQTLFSGKTRPYAAYVSGLVQSAVDSCAFLIGGLDNRQNSLPTLDVNEGNIPTFGANGPLPIINIVQAQDQVPFDMDMAINNGANIFSVRSKTFTEP